MATDVVVPEVGETGMDVVFVRWRKAAGDPVAVGDILFELDTEKTVVEVEAWIAGTLVDLGAHEGDVVAPRQVVARILASGEAGEATPTTDALRGTMPPGPAGSPVSSPALTGQEASSPAPSGSSTADVGTPPLSPRARALARELGIDPAGIAGSGPGGLVTEQDIRMAASGGADPR